MKNKKGFTLIELLATIIILGLLTSLVIMTVMPILNRGHDEYYKNQEAMLLLAGKEYFSDNRDKLPKEIGETSKVTLKKLIEEKYIDPIKDRNNNDCDFENSTVTVQKISDKEYNYYVNLICGDDKYQTEGDYTAPVIKFTPNTSSSASKITVKMKVTDNEEVSQYRYVIMKDGTEYFDSSYKNYENEVNIEIEEVGTYKIIGYATDKSENNAKKESGTYKISSQLDCSLIKFESDKESNVWYNKDINVKVVIPNDVYKYEISTKYNDETYQKLGTYIGSSSKKITFDKNGKNQIMVVLYDKNGNSCNTTSETYNIDKEKPTCVSSGGSTSWTRNAVTITGTCSDAESGCSSNVTKTYDSEGNFTNQSPGVVKDNSGNETTCPANQTIRIDRTPPVYTSVFPACGDPTGTGRKAYISLSFADYGSGLGERTVIGYDKVTYYFPNKNFGGLVNGTDILATTFNYYGFSHTICDVVGNCNSWNDPRVNFNC